MLPSPFRLGPVTISAVELLAFLGFLVVAALARPRMKALGISDGNLLDLTLAALIGGSIGARLYYFLPVWIGGEAGFGTLFSRWGEGSGFYGGLVGGVAGGCLLAAWRKQPVLDILDAGFSKFPLGFATGKLGCFLGGCCYGMRCDGFPGVAFRPGSLAYQTQLREGSIRLGDAAALPVHPTQLYELAFGVLAFLGLDLLRRRSKVRGEIACVYFMAYSLWRFTIEFFRADPGRHGFRAGISDSQVMAILVGAAAAAWWVFLRKRGPERRINL